jgi:hypothetical protein
MTPHAALRTEEYWIVALRLTCFGSLSGYAHHARVMAFRIAPTNWMGASDGLLERLVRPFVSERDLPPGHLQSTPALSQTAQGVQLHRPSVRH